MADVIPENPIEKISEENENRSSPELQKQQSEDKTINSQLHDSEYDTANYTSDDEEDDLSSTGSEEFDNDEEQQERQLGDGQEQNDFSKKVDEDRSNPQYIPKKGTFYEHDDRTTDDPDVIEVPVTETNDGPENNSKTATPTISSASKTMKKWQPASDRWSHDRFEENEQAPKSRAELVSAYGYDIRNEDGPPRARRRRRYGRGPTKYNRNWEDESAYIKANNVQRKPLRQEDFPALGERKPALPKNSRNFKEEKENHYENRRSDGGSRRGLGGSGSGNETGRNSVGAGKNGNRGAAGNSRMNRSTGFANRKSNDYQQNKNRSNFGHKKSAQNPNKLNNIRDGGGHYENSKSQVETISFTNTKVNIDGNEVGVGSSSQNNNHHQPQHSQQLHHQPPPPQQHQQLQRQQPLHNDRYNNGFDSFHTNQQSPNNRDSAVGNNTNMFGGLQQQQQKLLNDSQLNGQKLTSRIQHGQHQQQLQRSDPSHVGSIQMHTLASPQQNLLTNVSDLHQQAPPPSLQDQGKPKRYSSLRQRAPNDSLLQSGPSIDQINLQQMHIQHDGNPSQQQPPPHVLLYHQQEQAIQNLTKNGPPPPPGQFQNAVVQSQYPPPAPAFYAAGPPPTNVNDYGHGVVAGPPPTANAPPMLQLAAAYMQQQQQTGPAVVQSQQQPQPPLPQATNPQQNQPPPPINYVQSSQAVPPPPQNPAVPPQPYQNYPPPPGPPASQYPNYNTVGGTTYFVPHAQPAPRSNALPLRRPTNAIPILAPPSDKSKQLALEREQVDSLENIDHILDNMFVQRAPFVPPQSSISSSTITTASTVATTIPPPGAINESLPNMNQIMKTSESNRLNEAIKNMQISDNHDKTQSSNDPDESLASIEKKSLPPDSVDSNASPELVASNDHQSLGQDA